MRSATGPTFRTVVRNAALNFGGQVVPLAVGVVAIPFILRRLGAERYGLFALAWVVLGYFSLLDLGLGRATAKFVAERFGRNDPGSVPGLFWTSAILQMALGIVSGGILWGTAPILVHHLFDIPTLLAGEALAVFRLVALAIPVVLVSSAFTGVLEAAQRFDLTNVVRTPLGILNYAAPVLVLSLGGRLTHIIVALVGTRVLGLAVSCALAIRIMPRLGVQVEFSRRLLKPLLAYGGWLSVSNIVGPVMTSLDRLAIGVIVGMAAVAYYSAPYDIVTRLWILPGSFVLTLFPAFSSLAGAGRGDEIDKLARRSLTLLAPILVAVVGGLVVAAPALLDAWLGPEFAIRSARAFQILAVGVGVNALAQVPYTLLQGTGRADLTAKLHLIELPVYALTLWTLVPRWGISGAAAAWSLRVSVDAVSLFAVWAWARRRPGAWGSPHTRPAAGAGSSAVERAATAPLRCEPVNRCPSCRGAAKPLYRALEDRLYGAPGVWSLSTCERCRLTWLNPRPIEAEIGSVYAQYYTHQDNLRPPAMSSVRTYLREAILAAAFGYRDLAEGQVKRWVGAVASAVPSLRDTAGMSVLYASAQWRGRLLEVGCGNGEFLLRMRALGWDVAGVEPDQRSCAIAAARLPGRVHAGGLHEAGLASAFVDLICMHHVIEHMHSPASVLAECHRILRPGGRLALATPNASSLGHRIFGSAWVHLDPPRHLHLFERRSITHWVEQAGFVVEVVRTSARWSTQTWWASRLIRARGRADLNRVPRRLKLEALIVRVLGEIAATVTRDSGEELLLVARKP